MSNPLDRIAEVLRDQQGEHSDWLKRALKEAIYRDAVDAANDAEVLAELLADYCNKLHAKYAAEAL